MSSCAHLVWRTSYNRGGAGAQESYFITLIDRNRKVKRSGASLPGSPCKSAEITGQHHANQATEDSDNVGILPKRCQLTSGE
jgi:hypothetical protein